MLGPRGKFGEMRGKLLREGYVSVQGIAIGKKRTVPLIIDLSSTALWFLWLMLLLCPSKQGAFVQNRATDEMYSSPV